LDGIDRLLCFFSLRLCEYASAVGSKPGDSPWNAKQSARRNPRASVLPLHRLGETRAQTTRAAIQTEAGMYAAAAIYIFIHQNGSQTKKKKKYIYIHTKNTTNKNGSKNKE